MQDVPQLAVAIIVTFAASSGFWSYLSSRRERKSATTRLLMGLAYDKLVFLGMKMIERGHLSKDEYEDYRRYLYEPYKELGGNGVSDRIMEEISKLPLRSTKIAELQVRMKNEYE